MHACSAPLPPTSRCSVCVCNVYDKSQASLFFLCREHVLHYSSPPPFPYSSCKKQSMLFVLRLVKTPTAAVCALFVKSVWRLCDLLGNARGTEKEQKASHSSKKKGRPENNLSWAWDLISGGDPQLFCLLREIFLRKTTAHLRRKKHSRRVRTVLQSSIRSSSGRTDNKKLYCYTPAAARAALSAESLKMLLFLSCGCHISLFST